MSVAKHESPQKEHGPPGTEYYELKLTTVQQVQQLPPLKKQKKNQPQEGLRFKWSLCMTFNGNPSIEHIVRKVDFYLHDTFPEDRRHQVFKKPPFLVEEVGYGNFEITIQIHYKKNLIESGAEFPELSALAALNPLVPKPDKPLRVSTIVHELDLNTAKQSKTQQPWILNPGEAFHTALQQSSISYRRMSTLTPTKTRTKDKKRPKEKKKKTHKERDPEPAKPKKNKTKPPAEPAQPTEPVATLPKKPDTPPPAPQDPPKETKKHPPPKEKKEKKRKSQAPPPGPAQPPKKSKSTKPPPLEVPVSPEPPAAEKVIPVKPKEPIKRETKTPPPPKVSISKPENPSKEKLDPPKPSKVTQKLKELEIQPKLEAKPPVKLPTIPKKSSAENVPLRAPKSDFSIKSSSGWHTEKAPEINLDSERKKLTKERKKIKERQKIEKYWKKLGGEDQKARIQVVKKEIHDLAVSMSDPEKLRKVLGIFIQADYECEPMYSKGPGAELQITTNEQLRDRTTRPKEVPLDSQVGFNMAQLRAREMYQLYQLFELDWK